MPLQVTSKIFLSYHKCKHRNKNSIRVKTILTCVYINCWDQSLNYFFFKSSLFLHIKIHQTVKFEENL